MTVPDLVPLPFDTDDGFGSRARIGLIVLESDQTIEAEARMLDLPDVDFYHSRIPNSMEVTSEDSDRHGAAASGGGRPVAQ